MMILLTAFNMAAPPSLNLLGEISLLSSLVLDLDVLYLF